MNKTDILLTDRRRDLLNENPKALQFLHISHGFDFERPAVIIRGAGSFTHNSVKKQIAEHIEGEYTAAVLVKRHRDYMNDHDLYLVNVGKSRFIIDYERTLPYYNHNIDYFFSVGSFEDARKHETQHYYIIAQSNENLTKPRGTSSGNLFQRFRYIPYDYEMCSDGRGNHYVDTVHLMMLDGSAEKFFYTPQYYGYFIHERPKSVSDVIDKSGYIVLEYRLDLKRRARARKAEKDAAAARLADFTAEERAIEEKAEAVRHELAAQILACVSYEDAKRIEDATADFRRALYYLDKHKRLTAEGTYKSIESIERQLESVNSYLNRCEFILKGEN